MFHSITPNSMKKSVFSLVLLCAGTLLLGGCGDTKPADTATAETAAADTTAAGMAGMHHSDTTAVADAPLLAAMHNMMTKMDAVKPRGNTDYDFARQMLEHHKAAVDMAEIELRDGKDATMRHMAEEIKTDQQKEINELGPIAERLATEPTNYKPSDQADPFTSKMKASMAAMMQLPPIVADADMNFNMLMTTHHQSAVEMAQAELAHGKDDQLKKMAQMMVTAQQKEIAQFKAWHAKNTDKMKPATAMYECPMGDGGRSNAPGSCPKCGMDLEKKS
jgi:uncharacterized protein (DUF305 family)